MLNNSTDDPIINRMYMFKNINLYSNYLRSDEEKILSEEESNEIIKKFLLFSAPHKICMIIQQNMKLIQHYPVVFKMEHEELI